ncbi:TPA: alanine--tRNA ligase [Candidatus Saccharibacteria bacterium]|nr:alanine--tRNA ligase [Candidatus Saccharibacteria bacterium]HIO87624.1 alanine--tRNA ligase [Candidatus Saccharibacteria bacterium]
MTAQEIRRKYLEFFKQRGHTVIPRANLVPHEDATTLFTGSGMQPLVPYLLGEEHPSGTKLVDSQTCLRAEDIDEVGDDSHTTFFEMLGNWSLGEYFKKEQIEWISEFFFDEIGLDINRFYVSCYIGNEKLGIPRDDEAIELWKAEFAKRGIDAKVVEIGSAENGDKVGMQGGRIFLYDGNENWWSRGGNEENTPIGDPCGPDSEMFFDFGEQYHDESVWGKPHPASDSQRFFELGNNVFMAYRKTKDGVEPLANKNIDHGSGLERITAAVLDNPDVFEISLLKPIIEQIEKMSGRTYSDNKQPMRVIADHLRAATWLAVDGTMPSNNEQGYVVRRLCRRAIRFALELGIERDLMQNILPTVFEVYEADFSEFTDRKDAVLAGLTKEETTFRQTLRKGVKELKKLSTDGFNGEVAFKLYDTYGFPVELSLEEAQNQEIEVAENWQKEFEQLMKEQKDRSRTATKGQFKGGLGGDDVIHKKYHTATHLTYRALREVLGDHVLQRGSNITGERMRFDFEHPEKMTPEQIKQVEDFVNEKIAMDLDVSFEELPTDEAIAQGAYGAFGDKYGDTVKVYSMKDQSGKAYSFEICGGPHVEHTGQLAEDGKVFKITKEQSSSAGVRRIKAVLR